MSSENYLSHTDEVIVLPDNCAIVRYRYLFSEHSDGRVEVPVFILNCMHRQFRVSRVDSKCMFSMECNQSERRTLTRSRRDREIDRDKGRNGDTERESEMRERESEMRERESEMRERESEMRDNMRAT
ncbi:hypothetical protein Bpfe_028782 [Biomphalaria pfeifferi]|uniref:Uncharacterized protein n=1 Tax=Biomphalaria pfeifferi TaxID=112525 RepID=A0AAD8EVU3_BIOPF|nr:hypothetical protein Bpfe_028782 [Biomphalaria pfeifferi]